MSNYLLEIEALQRWVKATCGLNSMRLQVAPPKVARPVILWEAPSRKKSRNLTRWHYVTEVTQYGKLYIASYEQLADIESALVSDIEDKVGTIPIVNNAGVVIGKLDSVELLFRGSETLDVPLEFRYNVTYSRTEPVEPPAPAVVRTKMLIEGWE